MVTVMGATSARAANVVAVLALLVSAVSATVAILQTQRANEISGQAYALSESLAPQVDIYLNPIDAFFSPQPNDAGGLGIELELVNTGDVQLSGCTTYSTVADAAGSSTKYWPTVVEAGGNSWSLSPGEKHLNRTGFDGD